MIDSLISNFAKIAKFLNHPFVLMGFVLMLIFGVYDKILDKGIIPILSPDKGNDILQLILAYGFWLGLLIVILGFAWQFYKTRIDSNIKKKHT